MRDTLFSALICLLTTSSMSLGATAKEDADNVFDVMAMFTACQRFAGATDEEAKEVGKSFGSRMLKGFLENRPDVASELVKLVPEANLRYEKQLLFLRGLSWSNRKEICFGMEDTYRKLPK